MKRAFSQAMEEEAKRIAELEELDGRRRREVEEARKEKAGVRGMDGVWARLQVRSNGLAMRYPVLRADEFVMRCPVLTKLL